MPVAPLQTAPASSESLVRPQPGLARGRWEAPAWAFTLLAAAALLGGLAWIAVALRTRTARPRLGRGGVDTWRHLR